ncbi:hypothetical protein SSP531S_59020 [Streptomyces spongiicola]|uniref:Uncharacterized protein n=2 Tax=Streptomyces spongiicola TaxID=1690221 RepID=A0A388T781_9ACTN|nr:hypothetical protein SSP531S_59020 [Streptomyces spongiicola]
MKRAGVVFATAAAALLISSPAYADWPPGSDADNLGNEAACDIPYESAFKFHIYFNSGQNGAYRNIGWAVYNFDALRPGDGHDHPLKYCITGGSRPLPGSGQKIKNNAASGENEHYKYTARVHYNSGYKGPYDAMAPYQHIDRFRNVYNQNASFLWA